MKLLVITGPPAHGAKTLAAALSRHTSAAPVSYDQLNRGFTAIPPQRFSRFHPRRPPRWREPVGPVHGRWLPLSEDWAAVCVPGHPWLGSTRQAYLGLADAMVIVCDPARLSVDVESSIRELVRAGRGLGAQHVAVFINSFRTDPDLEALAEEILTDIIGERGSVHVGNLGQGQPEHPGPGLAQLWRRLEDISPRYSSAAPFGLAVVDTHRIAGRGLVVAGRVISGRVRVGDALQLWMRRGGALRSVRCISIQRFHRKRSQAEAGDCVGLLLQGQDDDYEIPWPSYRHYGRLRSRLDFQKPKRGSFVSTNAPPLSRTTIVPMTSITWMEEAPSLPVEVQLSTLGNTVGARATSPTNDELHLELRTPLVHCPGAPLLMRVDHRVVGWTELPP